MMCSARCSALAVLCVSLHTVGATFNNNPGKFLLASAPRSGKVGYLRIKSGGADGSDSMQDLISTGLIHPQGLAVDQKRSRLLVADPDSSKLFAYALHSDGASLIAGPQTVVASGVESRWVAVDATGNIYLTDEAQRKILIIKAGEAMRGSTTPTAVYDGESLSSVSSPGGVAVDNFYTYWVNKQIGKQVGSVVKAAEVPDTSIGPAAGVQMLSTNSDKSYGVCIALNNVFYTQPETSIFGIKKTGGDVMLVSDKLTNPRGCAFDGDGTVYVADRGANAIFSFAGNMQNLAAVQITKAAEFEDSFGVAVFSSAHRASTLLWTAVALVLAVIVQGM